MLSAAQIIELHATDAAEARLEALAYLRRHEDRAIVPEELVALLRAGILTAADVNEHDAAVAQREHAHERREVGVSARDILDSSKSGS